VSFPGLFHAWGKQVIAGIGWELVEKAVALEGGVLPNFNVVPKAHWHHQVWLNGQLYSLLAEAELLNAGALIAYYQFPNRVEAIAEGWRVEVLGQGVSYTVICKQIIDCSGGAEVVGQIGFERERGEVRQPGTQIVKFSGFDMKVVNTNKAKIMELYKQAMNEGRLIKGDCSNGNFLSFINGGGENNNHIFGADSSTAATQTETNLAGRRSILRLLTFMKTLPGCEKVTIEKMMNETAVRETYRIVGEYKLTEADYTGGRVFNDSVSYSFYPIDIHDEHGVRPKPLKPNTFPTIPLSCLIPKGSKNLIVAGRCLASDREANSAARVQASCMGMGQAAAVASVLAAKQNTTPLKVSMSDIRKGLMSYGAIVPT